MKTKEQLLEEFNKYKSMNLSLNMARGKPSKEQLDLSLPMMDILDSTSDYKTEGGIDTRNYGVLDGIPECKKLFSDILGVPSSNIIICGNSSLNIMFDLISNSMTHGVNGSTPWAKLDKIKWICPVPGYDRHFAITEYFNIEMISVPLNDDGPDMEQVEQLVKDPSVKGMWCVPQYSNPSGITYSEEVVNRLANLKPASKDFRIYWDNAYTVHHLYDDRQDKLLNIFDVLGNNKDLVIEFASTSKITFSGSGISAVVSSEDNIKYIKKAMSYKTIGFDKINQLRHVKFLKDLNGVKEHMRKHANILREKFELVERILSEELTGIATWSKPKGGYFISLNVKGCAKEVIARCKDIGVTLTDAGATYPYHLDPSNSNIRIAPSYPTLEELEVATRVLCLSVKLESR